MAGTEIRGRTRLVCGVALLAALLAPEATEAAGKRHAVLIGIKKYEHFSKLEHTENDVTQLAQLLRTSGYDVTLLTDTEGARSNLLRPTRVNILARLKTVLDRCGGEDTLLVAFAGHGLQFEKEADGYFCPCDGDANDPKTLVSFQDVYRRMAGCKAAVKLMLVDACRNDPSRSRSAKPGSRARGGLNGDNAPPPPKGVAVLFSCSKGQVSYENDRIKHGVFFHFVLEGMRGKARDSDGEVSWDSLTGYVRKQVAREVKKIVGEDAKQQPTLTATELTISPVLVPLQSDFYGRAKELADRKEYDQLIDMLRRASENRPEDVVARNWLAWAYGLRGKQAVEQGANEKSLADCNEALRLDPKQAWVYVNRSWAYINLGSNDKAIADCTEALRLDAKQTIAYVNRASAHINLGAHAKAIDDCTEALRQDPKNVLAYYNRALAYNSTKAYDLALADSNEALRLDPNYAKAYTNRAWSLLAKGQNDRAIADCNEALRLDSRSAYAYNNRAAAYINKKNYHQALADSNEALRYHSRLPNAYRNRSLAYSGLGDKQRAETDMATYRSLGGK